MLPSQPPTLAAPGEERSPQQPQPPQPLPGFLDGVSGLPCLGLAPQIHAFQRRWASSQGCHEPLSPPDSEVGALTSKRPCWKTESQERSLKLSEGTRWGPRSHGPGVLVRGRDPRVLPPHVHAQRSPREATGRRRPSGTRKKGCAGNQTWGHLDLGLLPSRP